LKNLLLIHLFLVVLLTQATAQVYNRPLSEAQTFYIPSDAVNNDVVGTVLAYPEFHNIGIAPMFTLRSNVDNIYAVSSTGVITVSNNTSLAAGNDVITVTISKSGYASYDINVTITCISVATNTLFIDPSSTTNGTGTRANPKNAIPDINANNGYKYWFKRGTTLTVTSSLGMVSQTNKYFCSYGQCFWEARHHARIATPDGARSTVSRLYLYAYSHAALTILHENLVRSPDD